jgi:hypothetical protein
MSDAVGSIRNISGDDRILPLFGGRLVMAGAVIEVARDQVTSYTQQESIWAPYDDVAQAEHDAMLVGIAELLAEQAKATEEAEVLHNMATGGLSFALAADIADDLGRWTTAKARTAALPHLDLLGAQALLEDERARPAPRPSVVQAAEKRITELTQEG